MSGITGLFLYNSQQEPERLVTRMSRLIAHRGTETIYKFIFDSGSSSAFIAVRELWPDQVYVQSKPSSLLVIEQTPKVRECSFDEIVKDVTAFNLLVLEISTDGLRAFRSSDGTKGLYIARIDTGYAFSSEKKNLWKISSEMIQPLLPGQVLSIDSSGRENVKVYASDKPHVVHNFDKQREIDKLASLLNESFQELKNIKRCAVLFSGGIDSSLAAYQTTKYCSKTLLVTALCRDSHDTIASTRAAELLGIEHVLVEIDENTIWHTLPEVIYAIETSERMHVEIALPFFLAAREARIRGYQLAVSGQGPDELFAGYAKHERIFKESGPEVLESSLRNEIRITHENNLQRDARAVAFNGLDIFFPFLQPSFVRTALSIPARFKINPGMTPSRKIIFRELAMSLGLPRELTKVPKRATQYSSGISKLLATTVSNNVEGETYAGKKQKTRLVQVVLDTIASKLDIPIGGKLGELKMDFEPTLKLRERLDSLAPSDER